MASIAHHVGSLVWVPEKGVDGTLFRSKKVLPRSIPAHSYVCVSQPWCLTHHVKHLVEGKGLCLGVPSRRRR